MEKYALFCSNVEKFKVDNLFKFYIKTFAVLKFVSTIMFNRTISATDFKFLYNYYLYRHKSDLFVLN
jgi:hypothetical protein